MTEVHLEGLITKNQRFGFVCLHTAIQHGEEFIVQVRGVPSQQADNAAINRGFAMIGKE